MTEEVNNYEPISNQEEIDIEAIMEDIVQILDVDSEDGYEEMVPVFEDGYEEIVPLSAEVHPLAREVDSENSNNMLTYGIIGFVVLLIVIAIIAIRKKQPSA